MRVGFTHVMRHGFRCGLASHIRFNTRLNHTLHATSRLSYRRKKAGGYTRSFLVCVTLGDVLVKVLDGAAVRVVLDRPMHADALLEERRVLGRLIVEETVGSRVDCCRRRKAARESESESVHNCGIGSLTPNTGYALVAYIELLGADGIPRIAQGLPSSAAGLLS